MDIDLLSAQAPGSPDHGIEVGIVAVDTAVREQPHKVQAAAGGTDMLHCLPERRILFQFAVLSGTG